MKKYYIEDLSTNEIEEKNLIDFVYSLVYNAHITLDYDYKTEEETKDFLKEFTSFLDNLHNITSANIEFNGFLYSFDEV